MKVVCLGLGRTGTSSMREALEILGFGPSYHMSVVIAGNGKDFPAWFNVGEGNSGPEDFSAILQGYESVLDYPAAMYPVELYAAYPDAKFILTTRDPAKWEKSMKATILPFFEIVRSKPVKSAFDEVATKWGDVYMKEKFHRGRIYTNTQQELLDHNARVRKIIPPEKLLEYEVGEGWERLVDFLGVPTPTVPFPHVNDTEAFQGAIERMLKSHEVTAGASE